jgi:hypothetical protein
MAYLNECTQLELAMELLIGKEYAVACLALSN